MSPDRLYRRALDLILAGEVDVTGLLDYPPADLDPEACWRCDALPAATDVGLCHPCRLELVETE